jgi:DNA helicase-2/ATP-dependent DNA helicase PcrA
VSPLSPAVIAALLRRPAPTAEQAAVITAPLEPGVVVAGAGSGKTETMAARVVWLVANGHLLPDQVLGLTFTRKAATELAERVRSRLAALDATGRVSLPVGEPTVSTYDAFAGRVVTEHGARLGVEPGRRLLAPAASWQRAARLVYAWDGVMDDVASAPETVVGDLLDLHEQAASHLASLDDVAAETARLLAVLDGAPPGPRQRKPLHSRLEPVRRAQLTRQRLLPLVREYRAMLERGDLADFATVAADAAAVAGAFGDVGSQLRQQYRLVLLDEFQDTSHAQLDLLVALFGAGHAVTAVGDPFQSIYAWRGANADTLTSFAERFGSRERGSAGVRRHSLRTSFRNATRVLDVANVVAAPLRTGSHHVDALVPVRGAATGQVTASLHRTRADQAEAVADQVAAVWHGDHADTGGAGADSGVPSVGVLVRKRDELPALEAALRERGIPVEVVGLDGLLTVPEVLDTVSALHVAVDPERGDALMRLLTGPAVRLGPRDIDALSRWARRLGPPADDTVPEVLDTVSALHVAVDPERGDALMRLLTGPAVRLGPRDIDALSRWARRLGPPADDTVPTWQTPRAGLAEALTSPPPPGWLTAEARERVGRLAEVITDVRHRLSRPVAEVVADTIHALGLDVETLARARRTGGAGTAHLDRLVDEAAQFAEVSPQAGMLEFLDYLAAAAEQERGLRRAAEVHLGARVQLLTVHAAKGLEWDVVVVAGLTDGGFPARSRTGGAWLTDAGTLPYPLRGDAGRLPRLSTAGLEHQSDAAARVDAFVEEGRSLDADEERRLAYVAVTRARRQLACHGYRWGTGRRPLEPSAFLEQIAACSGVEVQVWVDDPGDPPDPRQDAPSWPADPLGAHRPALQQGAAAVRAQLAAGDREPRPGLTGRAAEWACEAEVLLAEREASGAAAQVRLPPHLSATALVAARRDPDAFLSRLRRPMPVRPRVEARQGTAFHAWVEQRYGRPQLLDLDELPGAADALDPPAEADLAALQQAFLQSQWAERTPLEVEAPFETVIDGVVVRGRADAVFADGAGLVVVDWKTGPPPDSGAERDARQAQLAVYRTAFAVLHGLPVEQVRAVFHHVRENVTLEYRASADVLERTVSALTARTVSGAEPAEGRTREGSTASA